MQVTEGGTINYQTSLTQLEEKLLSFIGHSVIDGDCETSKPTITDQRQTFPTIPLTASEVENAEILFIPEMDTSDQEKVVDCPPTKKQKKDVHNLVQQQTNIMENINNNISTSVNTLKQQNNLLARIATAIENIK